MKYLKSSRAVKPLRKQLTVSPFSEINFNLSDNLLPLKCSPLTYNFAFSGGALTGNIGIGQALLPVPYDTEITHSLPSAPTGVISLWLFRRFDQINEIRDDRIVIRCSSGKFFQTKYHEEDIWHELTGVSAAGAVNTANYRLNGEDVLLISSEYGQLFIFDGVNAPYAVPDSPEITSMCIHYERLFATTGGEKNRIWFSDDFNPANWNVSMTEGGFIDFSDDSGRANKVISFLDHIYIFRDFGINRLTAYGDQSAFMMTKLFITSGRIYPDTVAAGGDMVFFLADDGIYTFDGVNARKILQNISPKITDKEWSKGCFHNGKYYLATRMDFNDGVKILSEKEPFFSNNVVIEFDINTGVVNIIRGADINTFLSINLDNSSMLMMSMRKLMTTDIAMMNESGAFFDAPLIKFWKTPKTDLGFPGRKAIRAINIKTAYDIKLGIIHDKGYTEYSVRAGERRQRIPVNITSEDFSVYLKSTSYKAYVSSFDITADVL